MTDTDQELVADKLTDEAKRLRDILIQANNFWRHEFREEVEAAADKLFKRLAGYRTVNAKPSCAELATARAHLTAPDLEGLAEKVEGFRVNARSQWALGWNDALNDVIALIRAEAQRKEDL